MDAITVCDGVSLDSLDDDDTSPRTYRLRIGGKPVTKEQYLSIPSEPVGTKPIGVVLVNYTEEFDFIDCKKTELLWLSEANELRRTPYKGDPLGRPRSYHRMPYDLDGPLPVIFLKK